MPYELFIALRYLRAKRRQVMVSVITAIAIAAVAAGVAALIIVLSMMTGFREEFQTRILSGTAHLNLGRRDGQPIEDYRELINRVTRISGVRAASATIYQRVLMQGSAGTDGAILKGVDMSAPPEANEVLHFAVEGEAGLLAEPESDPETGFPIDRLVLGNDLAAALGLRVGDIAVVISPQGHLTPLGMSPRYRDFKVAGIFKSGLADYDAAWAYISLEAAQRLSGRENAAELLQIKVDDVDDVKRIGRAVIAAVGDEYVVQDWQELNAPIYTALSYEKLLSGIALLLVVVIAALNIISVLIMIVLEKQRDIAILKSMGATARSVMWVFMIQGLLIGVVGLVIGIVAGTGIAHAAHANQLVRLPAGAYALDYLPFHIKLADVSVVAAVTLVISLVSTIYPSRNAARIDPVEALRYD